MAGEKPTNERTARWRRIGRKAIAIGGVPTALAATIGLAVWADSIVSNTSVTQPTASAPWCGYDTLGSIHTLGTENVNTFGEIAQDPIQYFEDAVSVNRPDENLVFSGAPHQVDIVTNGINGTVRPVCGYEQTIKIGDKPITIFMPLSQIENWNLHSAENNIRSVSGAVLPLKPSGNVYAVERINTAA